MENKFNYPLLQKEIQSVLGELNLPLAENDALLAKLVDYRHVTEFDQIMDGAVVRHINLLADDIQLSKPCLVCDVVIRDDGMYLKCKNFSHRYYHINMSSHLVFQKISTEERMLMGLLESVT